jgi:hypothetical protein
MAIRRLQHRHPTPETTDLERWVQAYERILKPLIAYMFLSEPRFLDHLTQSFAVPMQKSRHKQDHTETDDHAEAFFRAVMGLDAAQAATEKSARSLGPMRQADQLTNGVEPVAQPHSAACRVEVHERAAQSPARVRDRAFRAPPGFTHEERMAMQGPISKSTAIFERPFNIPGFDELLPAGEYCLETEIDAPPNHRDPEKWKASVRVRLHARGSHPGLARSLTVPLTSLDGALARDKHSGLDLVEFFVEEMLADPMIRLMMTADRISRFARSTRAARLAGKAERRPITP